MTAADRRAARYLTEHGWRRQQAHWWRRPGDAVTYTLAGALEAETAANPCGSVEVTSESEPTRRAPENRPPGRPA